MGLGGGGDDILGVVESVDHEFGCSPLYCLTCVDGYFIIRVPNCPGVFPYVMNKGLVFRLLSLSSL